MNEKMELNLLLLHGCYKKLAVQCSADTFVVNQTFVLRINICGENRQLLVAANRCAKLLATVLTSNDRNKTQKDEQTKTGQ